MRDDGCGIDTATRDRIFDAFFSTKSPGAGTGLGLTSTAEVVREADGSIHVDSDPDHGTAFHLDFPVSDEGDDAAAGELDLRPPRV